MNTNVNLAASIGALGLLVAAFVFIVAALTLIQSLVTRKGRRARIIVATMLLIAGLYVVAILAFSLASHDKVLARGEEKHFCELDCHLAYSVTNVRQKKTLGDPPYQETARGIYTIVTVKTHFDESTTGSGRGSGLLYPNSRELTLIDEQSNRYAPAAGDKRAFFAAQTGSTPMSTPLRPGDSYTTDVVFDLPVEAKAPKLLINEGEFVTHFVIGHENSPLHKKTVFRIDLPQAPLTRSAGYLNSERMR